LKNRQTKLIALTVGILFISFFTQIINAEVQNTSQIGSISLQLRPNPDAIDAGKTIKFILSFSNSENSSTINSARLITPWNNIDLKINETVDLNKVLFKETQFHVPSNASNGKYFFKVLLNTDRGDYSSDTEVNIKKIQSIPLSGDIPLSVLVIIFSGLITYVIPIFFLTHRLDRNYIEVTLASIGLGLLNWLVLNGINLVGDWGIISDDPLSIGYLLLFSLGTGFGIFLFISRIIKPLFVLRQARQVARGRLQDLARTGYTSSQNIWKTSLANEVNIVKRRLGRYYNLTLRVTLKSDPGKQLEGILNHFEPNPPHDLVLIPNYEVIIKNKQSIIDVLTEENSPIFRELKNAVYRQKLLKYLLSLHTNLQPKELKKVKKRLKKDDEIISEIKTRLTNSLSTTENFIKILDGIDISVYAWYLVKRLKEVGNSSYYYKKQFISGDDISSVEMIKYQCPYSISFDEKGTRYTLPRIYVNEEFHFIPSSL
jgi:hypothetical protein